MLCHICGLFFLKRKTLQQHVKEIHSRDIRIQRCHICGRPFSRKFNLKRHLIRIHQVPTVKSHSKMTHTETMTQEELSKMQKPVYFAACEDISSDEEPFRSEPDYEYEDISSDEEMLDAMSENEDRRSMGIPSISSSVEAELFKQQELQGDLIDSLLYGDDGAQSGRDGNNEELEMTGGDSETPEVTGNSGENCSQDNNLMSVTAPVYCRDGNDSDTVSDRASESAAESEISRGSTVTHTISLVLTRTTTRSPNGNVEVNRQTQVHFSENIDANDVDIETLIRDVLFEIPVHFQRHDRREMHGDYSV